MSVQRPSKIIQRSSRRGSHCPKGPHPCLSQKSQGSHFENIVWPLASALSDHIVVCPAQSAVFPLPPTKKLSVSNENWNNAELIFFAKNNKTRFFLFRCNCICCLQQNHMWKTTPRPRCHNVRMKKVITITRRCCFHRFKFFKMSHWPHISLNAHSQCVMALINTYMQDNFVVRSSYAAEA